MQIRITAKWFHQVKIECIGEPEDRPSGFSLELPCTLPLYETTAANFISLGGLMGKSVCLTWDTAWQFREAHTLIARVTSGDNDNVIGHFYLTDITFPVQPKG